MYIRSGFAHEKRALPPEGRSRPRADEIGRRRQWTELAREREALHGALQRGLDQLGFALGKQLPKNRAVASLLVLAIATQRKIRLVR